MHKKNQVPEVRRFRVRVGRVYCTLNEKFHVDGVCLPDAESEHSAAVFKTLASANNAVGRTQAAQEAVSKSLAADSPCLKPLLFKGQLEVEEFLTTCAE